MYSGGKLSDGENRAESPGTHLAKRLTESSTGFAGAADEKEDDVMGLGKKAKNSSKEIKGKAKKNAGKATGNRRLEAKGKAGETTGKLRNAGEKVKDAFRR